MPHRPSLYTVLRYMLSPQQLRARLIGPRHRLVLGWQACRRPLLYLLLALLLSMAQGFFLRSVPGEVLVDYQLNFLFLIRGKLPPPPEVAMIAIDDRTHRRLNIPVNQAFPRIVMARGLEALAQLKPKRVVIDFVMRELLEPESDTRLARALSLSPTVIGHTWQSEKIELPNGGIEMRRELIEPAPLFLKASAGSFSMLLRSVRGVVRRFRGDPAYEYYYPSAAKTVVMEDGQPPVRLPTPHDYINFYGPAGTIEAFSFYRLFDVEMPLPPEKIRDRTVFIGMRYDTTPGENAKDVFMTSFGHTLMYGVEIHATAGANLLRGDWIKRLDADLEDRLLFVLCGALCVALLMARGVWMVVLTVAGVIGVCALGWGLFKMGYFFPVAALIFILPCAAGLSLFLLHLERRAEKRREQIP